MNIDAPGAETLLTFSKNNGKYMFTNYPEQLGADGKNMAFTDNGYYINKATFDTGEHHIFYSHNNFLDEAIRYGMLVRNTTKNRNVTVTRLKFECSSNWESAATIRDFFKNNDGTQRTLAPGEWWVINQPRGSSLGDQEIGPKFDANGHPFHGIMRIHTTGAIEITCYAYKDTAGYAGNEKVFPRDSKLATNLVCSSGLGTGYLLNTAINLEIGSNLTSSKPFVYRTSYTENTNDIIPIVRVQDGVTHPLREAGNYTAQYDFTITIKNSTSSTQTVYDFTSSQSGRPCFVSGSDVQANEIGSHVGKPTWRWFAETIPANTTKTFTYSLANGSYGNAILVNAFSLNPNLV